MLVDKRLRALAKWTFLWSSFALVLQLSVHLLGAGYDSRATLLWLLWWITQLVIIPIWVIFEGLSLLGPEVRGYVSSLTINLFLVAVSFVLMLTMMVKRG
jgi:hypothetical protein